VIEVPANAAGIRVADAILDVMRDGKPRGTSDICKAVKAARCCPGVVFAG
jgi:hypothetical protein